MPLFAFANAGIARSPGDFGSSVTAAVFVGFAIGKPMGVLMGSWLAVRSGIALRPPDLNWSRVAGGVELGILAASAFSAVAGLAFLMWMPARVQHPQLDQR